MTCHPHNKRVIVSDDPEHFFFLTGQNTSVTIDEYSRIKRIIVGHIKEWIVLLPSYPASPRMLKTFIYKTS